MFIYLNIAAYLGISSTIQGAGQGSLYYLDIRTEIRDTQEFYPANGPKHHHGTKLMNARCCNVGHAHHVFS